MKKRIVEWLPLPISILALLVSMLSLVPIAPPVATMVYTLSIWTGNEKDGATLRYLGVLPISYCYLAGASFERMKKCAVPHRV